MLTLMWLFGIGCDDQISQVDYGSVRHAELRWYLRHRRGRLLRQHQDGPSVRLQSLLRRLPVGHLPLTELVVW